MPYLGGAAATQAAVDALERRHLYLAEGWLGYRWRAGQTLQERPTVPPQPKLDPNQPYSQPLKPQPREP